MRISFICGSLEPGRDGVGDYTQKLSGELIRQGHSISIIALNDHHISLSHETILDSENAKIPSLRLASVDSDKIRIKKASNWVKKNNPDWISLQFVPFSFQNKGIPWNLGKQLSKLGKERKWHIMFHELWVGMEKRATIKHRVLGKIQQYNIKDIIDVLYPQSMNTHTKLYKVQLNKMGFKVNILPLFGNIPNFYPNEKEYKRQINIAVFGGIHQEARLKRWLELLPIKFDYTFHFIGNNGPERDNWIKILKEKNIEYILYGWLKEKKISEVLSKCQLGLCSTPYYLSEKSGSTAAMLEHNLIVFCVARNWCPRNIQINELVNESIVKWKNDLDIESLIMGKKYYSVNTIEAIAENFINGLKASQF